MKIEHIAFSVDDVRALRDPWGFLIQLVKRTAPMV